MGRTRMIQALLVLTGVLGAFRPGLAGAARRNGPIPEVPQLALQFGHLLQVNCVAYAPDSRILLSGGNDGTIKVWDTASGELLHTWGTERPVYRLLVSPDGRRFYSGDLDGSISAWELPTGKRVWRKRDHNGMVRSLALSRDGKTLVSAGDKHWVTWVAATGEVLYSYWRKEVDWDVFAAALSPDGLRVAVADFGPEVLIWNLPPGSRVGSRAGMLTGHKAEMKHVAYSPAGSLLGSGSVDGTARLWDALTLECRRVLRGHTGPVNRVEFSSDEKRIATLDEARTLRWWNVADGSLALQIQLAPAMVENEFALSPDGETVATAGTDGQVRLWSGRDGRFLRALIGQPGGIASVAFSPDGGTLAATGGREEGEVRLWSVRTGALERFLPGHASWVLASAFSPDGRLLATGGSRYYSEIRISEPRTGRLLRVFGKGPDYIRSLAFSHDGRVLASGARREVRLWNPDTGELVRMLPAHDNWVDTVAFSPDGRLLATGSGDETVKLWDWRSGTVVRTLRFGCWVQGVAFSPDGSILASGSRDDLLRLWDVNTGTERRRMPGHGGDVNTVAFSRNGALLASGSDDGTVRLWDPFTGKTLAVLKGHKNLVASVAFSPDGKTLASGSWDATVRLWDVAGRRLLATCFAVPTGGTERPITADARPITADARPITADARPLAEGTDYLTLVPGGYYSGSSTADRFVRFRVGSELIPAECFQTRYYRPEFVRRVLARAVVPPAPSFRGPRPPEIRSISAGSVAGAAHLARVTLKAWDDSRVTGIQAFLNGRRVDVPTRHPSAPTPMRKVSRDAADAIRTFTFDVPLPPEANMPQLQVVAIDDDGLRSVRRELTLQHRVSTAPQGRMLALCVGVSRYQDDRLNLRFASADAVSLTETLRGHQRLYAGVEIETLIDEAANRKRILAGLDRLIHRTGKADTVVLFLAGHGWRDPAGGYYIATHEVNRGDVSHTALSWSEIVRRLRTISTRCRRVLVLLDACHSGSAATNEELVRSLLTAGAGVMVLASSRGTEISMEDPVFGHGVFTQAVLEAAAGRAASGGAAGISIWDLATYVRRRVRELTQETQNPQVPFLHDFDADTPIFQARP